jgi:hypothetical protein
MLTWNLERQVAVLATLSAECRQTLPSTVKCCVEGPSVLAAGTPEDVLAAKG